MSVFDMCGFWSTQFIYQILQIFCSVDILVYEHFSLSTFWPVDILVWWHFVRQHFGSSTFQFVNVFVIQCFRLSVIWLLMFRSVNVFTSNQPLYPAGSLIYIWYSCTGRESLSRKTNTRATQEIPAPDEPRFNYLTSNSPFQSHKSHSFFPINDPWLPATMVVKHYLSATCSWSVQCYRKMWWILWAKYGEVLKLWMFGQGPVTKQVMTNGQ